MLLTCPCCGFKTIQDGRDVCRVCKWSYDTYQRNDPDYDQAPNRVSLRRAQQNFLECGISDPDLPRGNPPRQPFERDPRWVTMPPPTGEQRPRAKSNLGLICTVGWVGLALLANVFMFLDGGWRDIVIDCNKAGPIYCTVTALPTNWEFEYCYEVNGQTFTGRDRSNFPEEFQVGDYLSIYYSASHPGYSRVRWTSPAVRDLAFWWGSSIWFVTLCYFSRRQRGAAPTTPRRQQPNK